MPLILPNTIVNETPADGDKLQQNFAAIQSWANTEAITRDGAVAMTGPLLLPGVPTADNQAASKAYVDTRPIAPSTPVAGMVYWPHNVAVPTGYTTYWMRCQGQAVSRTTYAALFAVIGTKYGAGNGTTTFNLPNMTYLIKVL